MSCIHWYPPPPPPGRFLHGSVTGREYNMVPCWLLVHASKIPSSGCGIARNLLGRKPCSRSDTHHVVFVLFKMAGNCPTTSVNFTSSITKSMAQFKGIDSSTSSWDLAAMTWYSVSYRRSLMIRPFPKRESDSSLLFFGFCIRRRCLCTVENKIL